MTGVPISKGGADSLTQGGQMRPQEGDSVLTQLCLVLLLAQDDRTEIGCSCGVASEDAEISREGLTGQSYGLSTDTGKGAWASHQGSIGK